MRKSLNTYKIVADILINDFSIPILFVFFSTIFQLDVVYVSVCFASTVLISELYDYFFEQNRWFNILIHHTLIIFLPLFLFGTVISQNLILSILF